MNLAQTILKYLHSNLSSQEWKQVELWVATYVAKPIECDLDENVELRDKLYTLMEVLHHPLDNEPYNEMMDHLVRLFLNAHGLTYSSQTRSEQQCRCRCPNRLPPGNCGPF
jgi:hypothetical protein